MKIKHLAFLLSALASVAGAEGCAWDETPRPVYDAEVAEVEEAAPIAEEEIAPREEAPATALGDNDKVKMPDEPEEPEAPEESAPLVLEEDCHDGIDSDDDGDIDCKDSDCDDNPICQSQTVDPHQNPARPLGNATMVDFQDL